MNTKPQDIQIIGDHIAIRWTDGSETYAHAAKLRAESPSAENVGERDILGNHYGGSDQKEFSGITVEAWEFIGNYAIRFIFSDGHKTGLYTYALLKNLSTED
ncbi:MAG TPA: hypothetical protein DIU37_00485 [Opitutae bacterium]|nr:hypothetical protein [Opitutae bacterium]